MGLGESSRLFGCAFEDPEGIPAARRSGATNMRVTVPPARAWICCHVDERVLDGETTDEMKARPRALRGPPGQKPHEDAGGRQATADSASGPTALSPVGRGGRRT